MAESYQTNLLNVASCYVKRLKVPVTVTSLKQNLEESPYYPSLFSLSNTFERFQIPHEAFKIEKENFEQNSVPFIAYLKNQPAGKDFVLVIPVANNEVSYIAESKKDYNAFAGKYALNCEIKNKKQRLQERRIFIKSGVCRQLTTLTN
jgi:ABC-type bacteriocin/lantibiotic exporter with double-glycine peptidase domain